MATSITERPPRAQFERETSDAAAYRDGISMRTVAGLVLGVACLVVLTAVLIVVRKTYRPRRGC